MGPTRRFQARPTASGCWIHRPLRSGSLERSSLLGGFTVGELWGTEGFAGPRPAFPA